MIVASAVYINFFQNKNDFFKPNISKNSVSYDTKEITLYYFDRNQDKLQKIIRKTPLIQNNYLNIINQLAVKCDNEELVSYFPEKNKFSAAYVLADSVLVLDANEKFYNKLSSKMEFRGYFIEQILHTAYSNFKTPYLYFLQDGKDILNELKGYNQEHYINIQEFTVNYSN